METATGSEQWYRAVRERRLEAEHEIGTLVASYLRTLEVDTGLTVYALEIQLTDKATALDLRGRVGCNVTIGLGV